MPKAVGVNLVGGEYLWGRANGVPTEHKDYEFIADSDVLYLNDKGVKFVRLVFSWELMQPELNKPLLGSYATLFLDRVRLLRSYGIKVLIEPHGGSSEAFARWKGNLVGSAAVPAQSFADFWSRIAMIFKKDAGVLFGLSNEPNNMSTKQWFTAAQAAISAIRSTGSTNIIVCPGNGWSNAASWEMNWYDKDATKLSNAQAWDAYISDPLNKTYVGVHCYFDEDRSGGSLVIKQPFVGVSDLDGVVVWARQRGLKVVAGEFGASPTAPTFKKDMDAFLGYADQNRDVVEACLWWAYGPPAWWGNYKFTLCPKNNLTVDSPCMNYIESWFKPLALGPQLFAPDEEHKVCPAAGADSAFASAFTVTADMMREGISTGTYRLNYKGRFVSNFLGGSKLSICIDNPSSKVYARLKSVSLTVTGTKKIGYSDDAATEVTDLGDAGLLVKLTPFEGLDIAPLGRLHMSVSFVRTDLLKISVTDAKIEI